MTYVVRHSLHVHLESSTEEHWTVIRKKPQLLFFQLDNPVLNPKAREKSKWSLSPMPWSPPALSPLSIPQVEIGEDRNKMLSSIFSFIHSFIHLSYWVLCAGYCAFSVTASSDSSVQSSAYLDGRYTGRILWCVPYAWNRLVNNWCSLNILSLRTLRFLECCNLHSSCSSQHLCYYSHKDQGSDLQVGTCLSRWPEAGDQVESRGQRISINSSEEWVTAGRNSDPGPTQAAPTSSEPRLLSALLLLGWPSWAGLLSVCLRYPSGSFWLCDSSPGAYLLTLSCFCLSPEIKYLGTI